MEPKLFQQYMYNFVSNSSTFFYKSDSSNNVHQYNSKKEYLETERDFF